MLTRALGPVVTMIVVSLIVAAPRADADGGPACPPGSQPVQVAGGVVCVVVTNPGQPADPGDPGEGSGGDGPGGCFKADGTEVPCKTDDGYWWSAYQCYAAPYDAPPDDPAWQGHTDGSLWTCSSCESADGAAGCHTQILWTPPGDEPGPPTPGQLATYTVGLMHLAQADVHLAPAPPEPGYVGVENWLWIPEGQWEVLTKSVAAGPTTVTVTAKPVQVAWNLGPATITCDGPGRPWVVGMTSAATTTCGYTYDHDSSSQPDGYYPISATIRYAVTWACAGTCSDAGGDLGVVNAPAGTSVLRILQRQTVVVQ